MKKVITIVLIHLCFNAFAQDCLEKGEIKVFELDLAIPNKNALRSLGTDCSKKLNIHTSNPIAFVLKNANPYKYRYEIGYDFVDFFEDDFEDPFKKGKEATFKSATKSTSTDDDKDIENTDAVKKLEKELEEEKNKGKAQLLKLEIELAKLKNEKNILESKKEKLEEIVVLDSAFFKANENNEYSFMSSVIEKNIETINKKDKEFIQGQTNRIAEYENKIREYENKIEMNKNNLKQLIILEKQIKEKNKSIKEQFKKDQEEQKKRDIIAIATKLLITEQNIDFLTNKVDKYLVLVSAEDYLNEQKFKSHLEQFKITENSIIKETNIISSKASNIKEDSFIKDYNKKLKKLDEKMQEIKSKLNKMESLKFHNYLLPLDFNGMNIDIVQIKLKRHHKLDKDHKVDEFEPYQIWIKGGLKIDVSAGAFITSLVDGKYTISTKTSSDGQDYQTITQDNPGRFQYGFGSTLNVSPRLGLSWIKPSINLGVLFTSEQKFQFLAGLGVALGKNQRIVFQGGLSMGAITSIANDFKADGESRYNLGEATAPPTQEKFKFGHFFAVTYNFGKTKSQNDKKN